MAGGEAPELSEVEIDDRQSRLDKSSLVAPGLDLYHCFYSGHLYAEALRHVDIVLFRKDIGYVVATDGVGEARAVESAALIRSSVRLPAQAAVSCAESRRAGAIISFSLYLAMGGERGDGLRRKYGCRTPS